MNGVVGSNASSSNDKRTQYLQSGAYSIPMLGISFYFVPVTTLLAGFYAKYFALSLIAVATVLLVSKIFDAITDPLIGYYSDRFYRRTGSRKPFILIGGIFLIPSGYFLLVPPMGVGPVYFASWYMMFFLGYTLFHIPHMAWAGEFTSNSKGKTLAFSLLNIFQQLGAVMFYALPMLNYFDSTEITPQVLEVSAIIGAFLLLPGLYLALRYVPNGKPQLPFETEESASIAKKLISLCWELARNKPFLLFVGANIFFGLSVGTWLGLFFTYVDAYLIMGDVFAKVAMVGMIFSVVTIPLWYRLSLWWGRARTWFFSVALVGISFLYFGTLTIESATLFKLIFMYAVFYSAAGGGSVMASSILGDISNYGTLKTGVERNATYYSVYTLQLKLQAAFGGALGLATAGWFGFDAAITNNAENSIMALRLTSSVLPALLALCSLLFIALSPLDERRSLVIARRLNRLSVDSEIVSKKQKTPSSLGNKINRVPIKPQSATLPLVVKDRF